MEQTIETKPHRFSDRTFGWSAIFMIPALIAGLYAIEHFEIVSQTSYLLGLVVGCGATMLAHFLKK